MVEKKINEMKKCNTNESNTGFVNILLQLQQGRFIIILRNYFYYDYSFVFSIIIGGPEM